MTDPDDLFDQLGALPRPALAPSRAESIRRVTRAAFVQAAAPRPGPLAGLAGFYARALEPAMATLVTTAYLAWAVAAVVALSR